MKSPGLSQDARAENEILSIHYTWIRIFLNTAIQFYKLNIKELGLMNKGPKLFWVEDADIVVVAFGLLSRIAKKAVIEARQKGYKVGLIRPVTLWPFPEEIISKAAATAGTFLSVEINHGQMIEDIKLAVNGKASVEFYGRIGVIPSPEEITRQIIQLAEREGF